MSSRKNPSAKDLGLTVLIQLKFLLDDVLMNRLNGRYMDAVNSCMLSIEVLPSWIKTEQHATWIQEIRSMKTRAEANGSGPTRALTAWNRGQLAGQYANDWLQEHMEELYEWLYDSGVLLAIDKAVQATAGPNISGTGQPGNFPQTVSSRIEPHL